MDLALNLPLDGPRGVRLLEALRDAILTGRVPPGTRLPASRLLAAQLNLSRGTVVTAYEELASEGYCVARVGAGTFVADLGAETAAPAHEAQAGSASSAGARPEEGSLRLSAWGRRLTPAARVGMRPAEVQFDFRSGISPDDFPAPALSRALRRAVTELGAEGGMGDPAGSPRLRRALVTYLARARGLRADPSQVLVVSGSQQGIDLAARLLLEPGDRVCIEEPGYPRARGVFQALGVELAPLPVDTGGALVTALPVEGARMVYVTPSHQYPTGAVLAPDRRLALLGWAEAHNAWVLEDDYDSEFRYVGPPLPCLQGLDHSGRCLYVGSLSKLLHPGLRIGYLVVPPRLVPAAVAAKSTLDTATSPIMQEALAGLFESGEVERHLRRASRAYRARRVHLLTACARSLPPDVRVWPVTGGLHAYVELPGVDHDALFREAARRGVALVDASDCYLDPPRSARLALWFSRIAADQIEPGIEALAEAIREAAGSSE